MNKGSSSNHSILTTVSIIIVILGVLLYWNREKKVANPATSISPISSPTSTPPPSREVYKVEELGLTLEVPAGYEVDKNVSTTESGDLEAVTLTIQKGNAVEGYYQLYMLTQFNLTPSDQDDLEDIKEDLEQSSVEDVTVAELPGVSGQVKGERNRFVTYFIKDGQLYSVATAEPTEENKQITDEILKTFKFTN